MDFDLVAHPMTNPNSHPAKQSPLQWMRTIAIMIFHLATALLTRMEATHQALAGLAIRIIIMATDHRLRHSENQMEIIMLRHLILHSLPIITMRRRLGLHLLDQIMAATITIGL